MDTGKEKKLTIKQKLFIKEYLCDLNATQAALRAGYSERTAEHTGYENLNKPQIKTEIDKALGDRVQRTEIKADNVLKELARLGMSDLRKYFNDDGTMKPIHELDDDAAAAVSSVEVEELFEGKGPDKVHVGYVRKFKLWDKNSALEKLGKHLRMFTDKIEFPDKEGNPQKVGPWTCFPPEPPTMEEWEAMVHGKKKD